MCRPSSEKAGSGRQPNGERTCWPASCAAGIAEAPCGGRRPPTSKAATIAAGTWELNAAGRRVNAEVVERQVLELLRWFDIPQHAQEDVAKAVIALCRETGGDDDYIRSEAARRELTLRRERALEMYRDGLCDKSFRDMSLA